MVKLADLASAAESASAGIVASSADVPITMSASATPRSRLMRELTRKGANVAVGDMAIRSLGKWLQPAGGQARHASEEKKFM
jgi:hypothetical protein